MRKAKIYARLQSQKTGAKRHVHYLLDGHGVHGKTAKVWTKGIPKKYKDKLAEYWSEYDKKWRTSKKNGEIGANSKVTYMQALIALPNDISEDERWSLAKQIMKMFPQKHPVTVVEHEHGDSGVKNRHFHIVFSYRKDSKRRGIGQINYEFRNSYDKRLKELLRQQYKKYGFKIEKNKKKFQISYKPQALMRVLLKKHGRDQMRNPAYLTAVVLPNLKKDAKKYKDVDPIRYRAACKSVDWITKEIIKAHEKELLPTDAITERSCRAVINEHTEAKKIWHRKSLYDADEATSQGNKAPKKMILPIRSFVSQFQTLKTKECIEASYHSLKVKEDDGSQGSSLPMSQAQQVKDLQEPEIEQISKLTQAETGMHVPEEDFNNIVKYTENIESKPVQRSDRSKTKVSGMFGHRKTKR